MITLKTLHEATPMEVFQQAKSHLLTQKAKSTRNAICAYRGENGTKCAAGCLIGDDEYSFDLEYKSWKTLLSYRKIPTNHYDLILKLQRIHDSHPPEDWEVLLNDLEKTL